MTGFRRGDVVLVSFVFADESGTKVRPALVISSAGYHRGRREAIVAAMRELWEVMKIIVEPSAAVPYAAIAAAVVKFPGQRVGIVLSGGNLDLDRLPWMTSAAHA